MATKVSQTIHIYSTVSFCMENNKSKHGKKYFESHVGPALVKPGKYACHVFQKFDSHGELVGE